MNNLENRNIKIETIQKINSINTISKKEIEDYLFTSETKLNDKQKGMFIKLAQLHNLNPFKREIYAIPYGKEFSIVTGYQVYIQRAEATGDLDGWQVESNNDSAKITIWRKSFSHPFIWEVDKSDFGKGYGSWKSMPKFMLKKVAIGQGFRLAFPNELGSMLYLKEEMEGAEPLNKSTKVNTTRRRNFTLEASKCSTIEELKQWWDSLSVDEHLLAEGVKKNRKEELQEELQDKPPNSLSNTLSDRIKNAKTTDEIKSLEKEVDNIEDSENRVKFFRELEKTAKKFDYKLEILPF